MSEVIVVGMKPVDGYERVDVKWLELGAHRGDNRRNRIVSVSEEQLLALANMCMSGEPVAMAAFERAMSEAK